MASEWTHPHGHRARHFKVLPVGSMGSSSFRLLPQEAVRWCCVCTCDDAQVCVRVNVCTCVHPGTHLRVVRRAMLLEPERAAMRGLSG